MDHLTRPSCDDDMITVVFGVVHSCPECGHETRARICQVANPSSTRHLSCSATESGDELLTTRHGL